MVGPIGCGADEAAPVVGRPGLVLATDLVRPGAEERQGLDHEFGYDALMRWEWEGGAPRSAGEGRRGDGVER